ncbi:hypothetical protein ACFL2B_03045 [Patescibacteria group bacterium]
MNNLTASKSIGAQVWGRAEAPNIIDIALGSASPQDALSLAEEYCQANPQANRSIDPCMALASIKLEHGHLALSNFLLSLENKAWAWREVIKFRRYAEASQRFQFMSVYMTRSRLDFITLGEIDSPYCQAVVECYNYSKKMPSHDLLKLKSCLLDPFFQSGLEKCKQCMTQGEAQLHLDDCLHIHYFMKKIIGVTCEICSIARPALITHMY